MLHYSALRKEIDKLKSTILPSRDRQIVLYPNTPFPEDIDNVRSFRWIETARKLYPRDKLHVLTVWYDAPEAPADDAFTIRLPMPHPGQIHVLSNCRQYTYVYQGRGGGKTWMLVIRAIRRLLTGRDVLWLSPSHTQSQIGEDEFASRVGELFKRTKSKRKFETPFGSAIKFFSLESKGKLRGFHPDDILIDEIGETSEAVMTAVVMPMIAIRKGTLFAVGTPTPDCWVDAEFEAAADSPKEYVACWRAPVLGVEITERGLERRPHPLENPHQDFEELVKVFHSPAMTEDRFRQEYLAESLRGGGEVFRHVDEAAVMPPDCEPDRTRRYAIGIDTGRTDDATVYLVMDIDAREMVDMVRLVGTPWEEQKGRLVELYDKWRPVALVPGSRCNSEFLEWMETREWPVAPFDENEENNVLVVDRLRSAFERRQIKIQDVPVLISELKAFRGKRSQASGKTKYGAPKDRHDDCVDALMFVNSYCIDHSRQAIAPMSRAPVMDMPLPFRAAFLGVDADGVVGWLTTATTDGRMLHVESVARVALDPRAVAETVLSSGCKVFGADPEVYDWIAPAWVEVLNRRQDRGAQRLRVVRNKEAEIRQMASVHVPLVSGIVTVSPRVADRRDIYFSLDRLGSPALDSVAGVFELLKRSFSR